jgi:hypothetical protein
VLQRRMRADQPVIQKYNTMPGPFLEKNTAPDAHDYTYVWRDRPPLSAADSRPADNDRHEHVLAALLDTLQIMMAYSANGSPEGWASSTTCASQAGSQPQRSCTHFRLHHGPATPVGCQRGACPSLVLSGSPSGPGR